MRAIEYLNAFFIGMFLSELHSNDAIHLLAGLGTAFVLMTLNILVFYLIGRQRNENSN